MVLLQEVKLVVQYITYLSEPFHFLNCLIMKKIDSFFMLLMLCLLLSASACGNSNQNNTTTPTQDTATTRDTTHTDNNPNAPPVQNAPF
ncbi:MAG: hypothetical protein ICV82_04995 [Nitrososphaera sp.]|nr:hypothetical protein [Nitrososphaera sp.]